MGTSESKTGREMYYRHYKHKPVTPFHPSKPPAPSSSGAPHSHEGITSANMDDDGAIATIATMGPTASAEASTSISNNHDNHAKAADESALKSAYILADLLMRTINSSSLQMSYVYRLSMIESIRRLVEDSKRKIVNMKKSERGERNGGGLGGHELHRSLTEIVMEGVLTCNSIGRDDKDALICEGLFDQRWDKVTSRYSEGPKVINLFEDDSYSYLNYRRFIVKMFGRSRYFRNLPIESRQRLKAMILKTSNYETLEALLSRVLQRTCDTSTQQLILQDLESFQYYRLLLSDRLDCYDDDEENDYHSGQTNGGSYQSAAQMVCDDDCKPPAASSMKSAHAFSYGCLVLDQPTTENIETCPVCLDPIQMPALQLTCGHTFCRSCISDWIIQQQQQPGPSSTAAAAAAVASNLSDVSSTQWHCPVCRQEY